MKKAILKTLIYAHLFDFPLKKKEIWQRLIWEKKEKPEKKEFEKELEKLKPKDGFYFLPKQGSLVLIRKKREKESLKKIKKGKRIAWFLKIIPSIKLVAFSGSLALNNAKENDDIDFFIVTSSGWLWTTRFFCLIILSFLGVRRHPGEKEIRDKICPNMFLDEGHLDIFEKEKDLFLAYEILNLKPIWQRNNSCRKFFSANAWAKDFLPNLEIKKTNWRKKKRKDQNLIEKLFFNFQLWLMRKKITRERVTPYLIAFHPQSIRGKTIQSFNQKLVGF